MEDWREDDRRGDEPFVNGTGTPNLDAIHRVARIKVIGVGGAGSNAVNRMIEDGIEGVDFIVVNTDAQALKMSQAPTRLVLGYSLTRGLGAGSDPNIGREAAVESVDEIRRLLKGGDMVFVAAGMGGGTGTGGAGVIAKVAQELGALTIGIITTPFSFEGKLRAINAAEGAKALKRYVDSLIVINNDRLLEIIGGVPLKDSFKEADNILRQGVQTITDLIAVPSLINLDFADVKNVMKNKGNALFGLGVGEGPNRAEEAANRAIVSPLLDAKIEGARDAIINVTGGKTMTLNDANDAVDIVRQAIGSEANIIFGVAINEQLEDKMILTVIATGFDNSLAPNRGEPQPTPSPHRSYRSKNVSKPTPSDVQRQIRESLAQFASKSQQAARDTSRRNFKNDLPDFFRWDNSNKNKV